MNKASITAAFAQLLRDLPGEAPTGAQLDRWAERLTSAWCDELLGGELIDLDEALGSPLELTTGAKRSPCRGSASPRVSPPPHARHRRSQRLVPAASSRRRAFRFGSAHRRSDAPSHPPRRAAEIIADTLERVLQPHGLEVTLSSE